MADATAPATADLAVRRRPWSSARRSASGAANGAGTERVGSWTGRPARFVRGLPGVVLRWLRQRPGVLLGVVRRIPRADWALTAAVVLVWFGGIALLAASPYWYPVSLSSYWMAGWWIAGTLLLRRSAPVGTFWLTVLVYPAMYDEMIHNELHLVPLLVVALAVTQARALPPVLVGLVTSASTLALSLGYHMVAVWYVWGGWTQLLDAHQTSFLFRPWDSVTRVALVVAATVIGTVLGRLEETRRTLERRNSQLVALQEARAREAVRFERTRIARELHDVVAHHVSAIVVRAQAADRVADTDADEPRAAVRWIAGTGREALDAMRTVVRVLRAEDVEWPDEAPLPPDLTPGTATGSAPDAAPTTVTGPAPHAVPMHPTDTLAALPAVLRRVEAAGLVVDARLPQALPTLPPATELALLRVAQEALTNVLLHSAAQRVHLELGPVDGGVRLIVRDEGPTRPHEPGGGNGLVHMRERAIAAGGTLRVGPDGPGWRVELVLPVGAR